MRRAARLKIIGMEMFKKYYVQYYFVIPPLSL
jgi:hypothetical protein